MLFSPRNRRDNDGQKLFAKYITTYDIEVIDEHNDAFKNLEKEGFCRVNWHGERAEEIILNNDKISEIYAKLHRKPIVEIEKGYLEKLRKQRENYIDTTVTLAYIDMLIGRVEEHLSCKSYFNDPSDLDEILLACASIERNQKETYLRNFSKHVLGNSKAIEHMESKIASVFNCSSLDKDLDLDTILAGHQIYRVKSPTLVKGPLVFSIGQARLDLNTIPGDFSFNAPIIQQMNIESSRATRVITIENQTTFYDYEDPDAILVYLGGYASGTRIDLLKRLHQRFPDLPFYHWGDIDWGGFQIFRHLCRETGIDFKPFKMDVETLEAYQKECAALSNQDISGLKALLEKDDHPFKEVISWMLEHKIKLEQESLSD